MYFKEKTVDDLLRHVYSILLEQPFDIKPTRDICSEIIGVTLCLENPLARLSRTESRGLPFSALGEFLWYMKGDDSLAFIEYYIPRYAEESENGKIYGAYGPRLFRMRGVNQLLNVINLLKARRTSRRAVIQLFDACDIEGDGRKEIPCTCTLQFFIRSDRLHMVTYMRSNDAYKGLPHDIFTFTMLQEYLASQISVELGEYIHMVGSLHLYEKNAKKAESYLQRGYQSTELQMPKMPDGDNSKHILLLLELEDKIRKSESVEGFYERLGPYWSDSARLLEILSLSRKSDSVGIEQIQKLMHHNIYDTYIEKRLANLRENSR